MSIYVGNLSWEMTEQDIQTLFAEYGDVKRVNLPTDRETGRPRGFCFVEMERESDEAGAITALDGKESMGRSLKVNKAIPREESNKRSGGGYGGGGGGGGGYGGGGGRGGSSWR